MNLLNFFLFLFFFNLFLFVVHASRVETRGGDQIMKQQEPAWQYNGCNLLKGMQSAID